MVSVGHELGQDIAGTACLCYTKAEVWNPLEMPPCTCLVVDVSVDCTSAWLWLPYVGFLHGLIALEGVLSFKLFC